MDLFISGGGFNGATIDFLLSARRNADAARRFQKLLSTEQRTFRCPMRIPSVLIRKPISFTFRLKI
jgi:hypothetical protein